MPSIHVTKRISAPAHDVWAVLADFPNIADWNRGVKRSYATAEATTGPGAKRHCDLAPLGELEETITSWEPNRRMVVSIDSARKLPIRDGVATFTIDGPDVSVDYEYRPQGRLGRLVAPMLNRQLTRGFEGFLDDLCVAATAVSKP